jgi:hypothetical protein
MMFFDGHHLHQIPIWTGMRIAFLASYCGYSLGTELLGQHARSAASCMVILEQNKSNGRLFSSFPLPTPVSHGRGCGFESRQVHQTTLRNGLA